MSVARAAPLVTDSPPVSAIIVDYCAGQALVASVRSLIGQVAEVIVVDNASVPASETLLAAAGLAEQVTVIRNRSNRGFAAACNQGLVVARSPYLLFFNPDAEMPPGGVERLLALLTAHPSIGMVGPKLVDADGKEQWGGRRDFPSLSQALARVQGRDPAWPGGLHPTVPIEVPAVSGAAMLVRREAVAAVGVWDEGYFLHGEDLDWCRRFHAAGWTIWFEPHVVVQHAKGGCSHQRRLWVEWQKSKGLWRFLRQHRFPGSTGWLLAPLIWGGLLLRWGKESLRRASRHGNRGAQ